MVLRKSFFCVWSIRRYYTFCDINEWMDALAAVLRLKFPLLANFLLCLHVHYLCHSFIRNKLYGQKSMYIYIH